MASLKTLFSYRAGGKPAERLLVLMEKPSISAPRVKRHHVLSASRAVILFIVAGGGEYSIFHTQARPSG
ncbi:Uncharacterised protein [Klebsiella pneumoniae]|nr:Uncharacterised protein [Klebsiella pneumoniae]